jgi:hypothetical protein
VAPSSSPTISQTTITWQYYQVRLHYLTPSEFLNLAHLLIHNS